MARKKIQVKPGSLHTNKSTSKTRINLNGQSSSAKDANLQLKLDMIMTVIHQEIRNGEPTLYGSGERRLLIAKPIHLENPSAPVTHDFDFCVYVSAIGKNKSALMDQIKLNETIRMTNLIIYQKGTTFPTVLRLNVSPETRLSVLSESEMVSYPLPTWPKLMFSPKFITQQVKICASYNCHYVSELEDREVLCCRSCRTTVPILTNYPAESFGLGGTPEPTTQLWMKDQLHEFTLSCLIVDEMLIGEAPELENGEKYEIEIYFYLKKNLAVCRKISKMNDVEGGAAEEK